MRRSRRSETGGGRSARWPRWSRWSGALALVLALPLAAPAAAQPTAEAPAAEKPAVTPAPRRPATPRARKGRRPPAPRPVDPYAAPPPPAPADPYAEPVPSPPVAPSVVAPPVAPSVVPPRPVVTPAVTVPPPGSVAPRDPYATPNPPPRSTAPAPTTAPAPAAPAVLSRVGLDDLPAVQGLLAVQRLDGWLLFDRDGANPIAARLVRPAGSPTRPWFYLVPARGEPTVLVHSAEARSFEHLPGRTLTYTGYRDLDAQLKAMLKGMKTVAAEYSAKAAVPAVSRIDAGTIERIRAVGVQVRSSETLVQFTKAIWGDAGRTTHHIAVHHLVELRKDALAFIAKAVTSGLPITEYDVQQRIARGAVMRGLDSAPPVVAAGINTADPYYVPTANRTATIGRGDLVVITLAAKIDKPDGVWAQQTWVAIASDQVPAAVAQAFEAASLARDQALALIADRVRQGRPLRGSEVDDATRAFITKAGFGDRLMHRTGHSLDTDLQGAGADLDNFEVRDTRILTPGTGFTVGPGIYIPGQLGVRAEVSVYLSPTGPEVTTPAQDGVQVLLAR